ncbi:MAG: PD-(D/E)XK nuclease family protein [Anaerolineae bacterium]|nr:PD-(D/E)XK nuclease family protein [Anaerolineae bacterium]NUQ04742.1 PD-(D/E)XK nuclease family protein [Anaerolineae bacterium]
MPLILPDDFQFSQSALQDYADCHRRFFLRWVTRRRYPAPESEPMRAFEARMELGERFHQIIEAHLAGVPAEALRAALDGDETLAGWFERCLKTALTDLPQQQRAEITLSMPLADRRLVAKFDLLAIQPGARAMILDWKTAPRISNRNELAGRWQTLLYPYVLAKAGDYLNGGQPFAPEQINLVYWFAEAPDQPVIFAYDAAAHARAESRLNDLVTELLARPNEEAAFSLTSDLTRCRFCAYRSYCERGTQAGDVLGTEVEGVKEPPALALDLEQVAEIAF